MTESEFRKLSSSGPLFRASELERGLDDALDDLEQGAMPEPGGLIGGKYRVERLIACGGMGAVYEATHKVSGKRVAVKWMLPTLGQIKGARERFIREACATARIAHPNVVDIYDVGSESGSVYLVMEYLRGETLAQRMARGALSVHEAIALLLPALRGVAAAHAHAVIHRDLKPDNIFLCCNEEGEELEPKVLDFGISKITTDEVRDLAITHSGAVLGTPYYMSPEQVRGAREVDARTDVYAFGVMLFEALTGQWPFDAETYNELIVKIATEPTPRASDRNPDLHPEIVAVIERAMAREPEARFPNIESLALALEPFAGGVRFRVTRASVDSSLSAGDFTSSRVNAMSRSGPSPLDIRTLDSNTIQPTPLQVAPQRPRARMIVAAVALVLCAGLGVLVLRGRRAESASTARAGSQPTAANLAAPPAVAAKAPAPGVETSLSAIQAVSAPANATESNHTTGPRIAATKNSKRPVVLRDKRWNPAPPPTPEPVANKRLPQDWDDRISVDAPRLTRAADLPAGRIDSRDFR
jgi:serine/threonine protein kinase